MATRGVVLVSKLIVKTIQSNDRTLSKVNLLVIKLFAHLSSGVKDFHCSNRDVSLLVEAI